MRKRSRNVIAILVVTIIMSLATTSLVSAETVNAQLIQTSTGLEIVSVEQQDNSQQVIVKEGGVETKITISEDTNEVVTTMVSTETGKVDTLTIDKKTHKMYSSITGKTIDFSEEINMIKQDYNDSGIIAYATAPNSGTIKASYKKIGDAVGVAASLTSLAGLFLGMVSAAVPYPVVTTVAILLDTFSYALQMISDRLKSKPDSTTTGGKISYQKITYTKHQAGQVFHTYKYKVTSMGTY